MGKSKSAKQQVTDYRLSVHFGVCLGPIDYFRAIRVNEKDIWRGQAAANGYQSFPINNPNLFGGPKKEGGVEGTLHLLPGRGDQVFPSNLASRQGRTSATSVAYRGVATFFLTGKRIGEGFMWSTNSPIVATAVEADVTRMPKGLDPALAVIPNPAHFDKPDTNPAHIIYEAATDPVDGIMLVEDMDYGSFNAAAQTLFNEACGMSLMWTKPMECQDFINEIQGHINSVTYLDPVTGLLTIKLIRDDYDPETLFEINEDNAELVSFQRKFLGETVNEITVSYTDPNTEDEVTLTVHDLASAQTQGVVPDTRNFYGFRHADIAETAAWRELRTASAPLATVDVRINREGWSLRPGQPVRVYFPHEDPDQHIDIIARASEIDYGEPGAEEIPLTLTEDIFSLQRPPNMRGTGTQWVDESEPPSPVVAQMAFTLPAYMVLSPSYQERATDLEYPEVLAAVLGHHPSPDALSFELVDEEVQSTGELELTSAGTKTLTERGNLLQSIPPEATSDVMLSTLPLGRGPRIGGFVLFGSVETTQEIALITGTDGISWTLERGVLDTVPRSWPNGTAVWYLNPNTRFVDDRTVRSAGEEVSYRLLTRTSQGQLDTLEAPPVTAILTERPHLPLRPANVAVNGVPIIGTVNVATVDDISLTWATRNRLLEDGQVVLWEAAPVAPEYKQRTIVLVTDEAGNEIRRYVHLWTENAFVMPKAWFARWATVKVYVFAERDGLNSLQALGYTITGLANDVNAPEPPAAPDEGVPPSPVLAPGVGVFTAQGGLMDGEDGGAKIPAIYITGRRESPDYLALVVRYAKTGVVPLDWQYHPAATLDERDLQLPIAVSSNTTFVVECAYVANGVVGEYRALGEVTSGTLVADNVTNVGDRPALTVTYTLDQILVRQDQIDIDVDAVNAAALATYAARDAALAAESTASAAASNAVLARDIAEGHADGAAASAGIASTKSDEAGGYANSAASSASTATSQADLAGDRATAAQSERVLAETARGQAQTAAVNSATSASDASGYASAASSAAIVSAGARDAAILVGGNLNFDNGLVGWSTVPASPTISVALGGRSNVLTAEAGVTVEAFTVKIFPVDTSRKYRIRGGAYAGMGTGEGRFYIGFRAVDGNGTILPSDPGSYTYSAAVYDPVPAGTGWVEFDSMSPSSPTGGAPITGEGAGTWAIFPVGTKGIQLLALMYELGGTCVRGIDYVALEDITESQAAKTSANASAASASQALASETASGANASSATTQANNANTYASNALAYRDQSAASASSAAGSAAAAQSSATLAASAGQGWANPNAQFAVWTYPDISPDNYGPYGTPPTRVAAAPGTAGPGVSPYAAQWTNTNGGQAGIYAYVGGLSRGYYVVTGEVTLDAGSMLGVGTLFRPLDNAQTALGYPGDTHWYDRTDDNNVGGSAIGAGVVGQTYRVSTFVDASGPEYATMTQALCYLMIDGYWTAVNKSVTAKTFGVRRATPTEVELRQARQGGVTLSGRISEVASVAASATAAVATRTSTLEARGGGANLLTQAQWFENDVGSWITGGGDTGVVSLWSAPGVWSPPGEYPLMIFQGASAGTFRDALSPAVPVDPTKRYCHSAYLGETSYTNQIYLQYLDAAGATTGYAGGEASTICDTSRSGGPSLADFKRAYGFSTPPAGTVQARFLWRRNGQNPNGGYSFMVRPMISEATATQTEPPPWSSAATESRVSVTEGAVTTLNGRNLAYLQQEVNAGVGATAFVALRAETSPGVITSSVALGAASISLYNPDGQDWRLALRIEGGNAIFTGGLQAGTYIRQGSGQGWPVALASRDYNVGDGATLSWGTTFDSLPSYIAAQNNLDALATGEVYDVRLINVTTTGATAYAKIITVAVPTSHSYATTAPGSGPTHQVEVTSAGRGESNDGSYNITFYTELSSSYYAAMAGEVADGVSEDSGTVYMSVYALKSGVWTLVATEAFYHTLYFSGYANSGWNPYSSGYTETRAVQLGSGVQKIGVTYSSYDGGSGPYKGGAGSASNAAWTAPGAPSGTRTATPNGRLTRFTVTPR